jgi:type III secretory pathway component EscS
MEDYLQYLLYALIIVLLVAAGWGGKALLKIAETFLKNKIGAQNFEMSRTSPPSRGAGD